MKSKSKRGNRNWECALVAWWRVTRYSMQESILKLLVKKNLVSFIFEMWHVFDSREFELFCLRHEKEREPNGSVLNALQLNSSFNLTKSAKFSPGIISNQTRSVCVWTSAVSGSPSKRIFNSSIRVLKYGGRTIPLQHK